MDTKDERYCHVQCPVWLEDPEHFIKHKARIINVFQYIKGNHAIESSFIEWQWCPYFYNVGWIELPVDIDGKQFDAIGQQRHIAGPLPAAEIEDAPGKIHSLDHLVFKGSQD